MRYTYLGHFFLVDSCSDFEKAKAWHVFHLLFPRLLIPNNFILFYLLEYPYLYPSTTLFIIWVQGTYRILYLVRGHSYITSSHFSDFWTPLLPYVSMFLVLRISKNWHFLTPLPPTSADVIYEWSLMNARTCQRIHDFVLFHKLTSFFSSDAKSIN